MRRARRLGLPVGSVLLLALVPAVQASANHVSGATYQGTTALGGYVTVGVSGGGSQVTTFRLSEVELPCGFTFNTQGYGGDPIVNHAFSYNDEFDGFSYSGSFPSVGQAAGVFTYNDPFDPACSVSNVSWTAGIPYTLTVTVVGEGSASGIVESSPWGISCWSGDTCSEDFPSGEAVTLTADAFNGSFGGWTGCDAPSGATCTMNMTGDRSVTATFRPPVFQPDELIKWAGHGGFVGGDVYNSTGARQTKQAKGAPGSRLTFVIRLQNDGNDGAAFNVKGPGNRKGFSVRYLRGRTDITSQVVAGNYVWGGEPGMSTVFKLVVKVRKAAATGTAGAWLVVATAGADPAAKDAVKAKVKVVA